VQTLQYEIPASETCQQHIFQQKHKMLKPDNSNYYEYAIGGKTGYTSDALSTLITMADNGNMKLVCVVLRTHGKNIYPDTTNLFNYAFDNFEKIELKGQETSEDISEILEDESRENCGYVVVPKGVELSDLDMEMKVDEKEKDTAVLTYTYEGNFVGSAKAKVSENIKKSIARILRSRRKPLIMRRISPARRASDKCWSTCLS
jgi:D-alanyl-D-alanine carboxypeptidase (penicillin-binding protein 5/6)